MRSSTTAVYALEGYWFNPPVVEVVANPPVVSDGVGEHQS